MIIRMLYTVLLSFAAPFLLYGLFRKKSGKPHIGKRWKEHFGISPKLNTTKPLWIHAVSVGETIAATPLIKQIKQSSPNTIILLTTTTPTGAKQAETLGDLVEHRYMPVDFSFAVRAFIKRFSPSQLLIIETELWPNTLVQTKRRLCSKCAQISTNSTRLSSQEESASATSSRLNMTWMDYCTILFLTLNTKIILFKLRTAAFQIF